jgi:hypothetical protein
VNFRTEFLTASLAPAVAAAVVAVRADLAVAAVLRPAAHPAAVLLLRQQAELRAAELALAVVDVDPAVAPAAVVVAAALPRL